MRKDIYVLDANVFIEAAQRYYAFDLVPQFWQRLVEKAKIGRLCSIDRICDELAQGNDALVQWASIDFSDAFKKADDPKTLDAFRNIMNWVQQQKQFTAAAKDQFARSADGWLVAYAVSHECTVVTHEVFDANIKYRVKIPNICKPFDVPCVDTYAMLRSLGIRMG